MKTLKLTFYFTLLILTFSCDEDDDIAQNDIVAVWNLTSIEEQGVDTLASGCELSHTLTFSDDSTGNNFFPENDPGSPCDFETIAFTWSRNGDQLALDSAQEGVFIVQILLITDSRLEISVLENDNIPIPESDRRILKYEK